MKSGAGVLRSRPARRQAPPPDQLHEGAQVSSGPALLARAQQPACDVAGMPPMAHRSLSHARRLASATTSFLVLQALLSAGRVSSATPTLPVMKAV